MHTGDKRHEIWLKIVFRPVQRSSYKVLNPQAAQLGCLLSTVNTREKGTIGETIAVRFLEARGFAITERNYRKKWGEIDLIGQKDDFYHFFEVKSVTDRRSRAEDNVHGNKTRHIARMIETYFAEQGISCETPFRVHVICVYMNLATRRAQVKWIKDVIL